MLKSHHYHEDDACYFRFNPDIEKCDICDRMFSAEKVMVSIPEPEYTKYIDIAYGYQKKKKQTTAVCAYCYRKCSRRFLIFIAHKEK